jgi:predicted DCC family thiol-disulfide oxidoreductase YuxK
MIVVFDAKCLLCSSSVNFLLRHDRKNVFQFASIQGAAGSALLAKAGLQVDGLQTMLLCDGDADGGRVWQQTAAVIRIAHGLGWPWRMAWALWLGAGTLARRALPMGGAQSLSVVWAQ